MHHHACILDVVLDYQVGILDKEGLSLEFVIESFSKNESEHVTLFGHGVLKIAYRSHGSKGSYLELGGNSVNTNQQFKIADGAAAGLQLWNL